MAWYPLDGDTKDYSGNHNDGTANNFTFDGTTNGWTGGKFGKGLKNDGLNTKVTVPYSLSTDSPRNITLSAWIFINTFPSNGNKADIIDRYGADGEPYYLELNQSGISNGIEIGSYQAGVYYSALQLTNQQGLIGGWHNILGTYDGSKWSLYIDSALKATLNNGNGAFSSGSDQTVIGAGSSGYLNASLDDVRIYNRALSASEVGSLYAGSPSQNCDQTCKVWLKFDDNTGTTASDSVGSYAGTLSGSAAWTTGNFASAVSLNGTTSYVSVPNLGLTSGTVNMWVYPTAITGDQRLFAQASGASSQAGQLALNQSSGESGSLWVYDGSAWQRLAADGTVKAGQWNQIVVTNNGGTASAYVNGTAQLTAAAAFAFSGVAANIGGKFLGTTGGTFNGSIDDFRVYTRMISAEEVADQWRQGT